MNGATDNKRENRSGSRAPYPVNPGPANSLPAWTYRDDEFLDLEREHILMPSWQIVCHESDLPEPGDYQVLDILKESVVVIRDQDRTLRAFHNFCRHRGTRLFDGKGRNTKPVIVCPYHAWTYNLSGELRNVPEEQSFPGLDKSCFGLKPVELDTFLGFIFVRLRDDGGPSLEEMWAPYRDDMAAYRVEEMVPITPLDQTEWPCDWKIAVDNNLECYHIMIGHPGLHRMFGLQPLNMDVQDSGVASTVSHFKDKPSPVWTERLYQERIRKAATHLPADRRDAWAFYTMMPNIGLDLYPDSVDFFQLLPIGPERCVARYCVYALPDASDEMKKLRRLNMRISSKVMEEDDWLCRRVAAGIHSSAYEPGPLSEYEIVLKQFHDSIRSVLPVAGLPNKPRGRPLAEINAEMRAEQSGR